MITLNYEVKAFVFLNFIFKVFFLIIYLLNIPLPMKKSNLANLVILLLFLISCIPSYGQVVTDSKDIKTEIDKVPQNTVHGAQLKAVLKWCVEDADLANNSQLPSLSDERLKDAKLILSTHNTTAAGVNKETAAVKDLLPPLTDTLNNPYYNNFKSNVTKLLTEDRRFIKGAAGAKMSTSEGGWAFQQKSNEALMLVQAFCHPQSPYVDDPAIIAPIFRRFTAYFEYLTPQNPVFKDFGSNEVIADAYLIFRSVHPELIPPTARKLWESELMLNADSTLALRKGDYFDASKSHGLVNSDVGYVLDLAVAYRLFKKPEYFTGVEAGLRFIATSVLPDGGTDYFDYQNEGFSYHGIVVTCLARIAQLTELPEAWSMLRGLKWYYPLSVEPGGVAEWGSAPSWHHYWNVLDGTAESMIISSVTQDPYNKNISERGKASNANLWLASFYNSKIVAKPAPDNYIVFDKNIQGPRGRYGQWSFFGTGRNFGDNDKRGKSNYVGCMVLDDPKGFWPLNAALQDAGMEVLKEPKASYSDELKRKMRVISLAAKEKTATSVGSDCGALGSNSLLSLFTGDALPWRQKQVWIFTPERIIGLVTLSAEDNVTAFGLEGDLLLLSRGLNSGTKKQLITVGQNRYTYGNLNVNIYGSDFDGIGTEETDVFTPSGKGSVRLMLMDKSAKAGGVSTSYPKGTQHYYVVEICPKWSSQSSGVKYGIENGLLTLRLSDATGSYAVAYNPTETIGNWNTGGFNSAGKIVAHQTGEAYRPAWINDGAPADNQTPMVIRNAKTFDVAPNQILLLEQHN